MVDYIHKLHCCKDLFNVGNQQVERFDYVQCKTNFWLLPSRVRQFLNLDDIHPANGLWMTSEVVVRGYHHSEAITVLTDSSPFVVIRRRRGK